MSAKGTNLDVVAKLAGVSTATVSRVINGKPGVSKAKVEEIQGIIRRMKFQPVQRQRAFVSRDGSGLKHGSVAIIVLGRGHYDALELLVKQLEAISRACLEKRINPILVMGAAEPEHLPLAVVRRQIDGAIVFGDTLPPLMADHMEGIPIVWMTSHHERGGEVVLAGNFEIGQTAMNYLADKSCRRLAALNPYPANPVLSCRCGAFLLAAEQRGIFAVSLTPQKADSVDEGDGVALRRLVLEMKDRIVADKASFDGFFIPDDRIVAVAHPLLKEAGFLGSSGTRIISCGNECNYLLGLYPRPASIDIGPEILGDQAVRRLLRRTQGEDPNIRVNVTISPKVVEGGE